LSIRVHSPPWALLLDDEGFTDELDRFAEELDRFTDELDCFTDELDHVEAEEVSSSELELGISSEVA
jgi:hypothetical protein